jgi:hypothetical protein
VIAGTGCLVAGFFFKQTAAIAAAVPLVALMLHGRRPTFTQALFAVFPLAVMVGLIQGMKVANPAMYRAMIVMPRAFGLNHTGTLRVAMELLIDYPLFAVAVADWVKHDPRPLRAQPRMLWTVATLAIAYPFSAVTAAKVGGTWNSLLPALLAMTALVVQRLPRITALLDDPAAPAPRRLALGGFLAALMLVGSFPHMTRKHGLINVSAREPVGPAYVRAIAGAAALPGTVVSPEDPTIALFATGRAGRNLYSEYDCHLVNGDYPRSPPAAARAEIQSADYLIDVRWYFNDLLDDAIIAPLGFERIDDPAFDDACYRLWRRAPR